MLCHLIIIRLATLSGPALLEGLDSLVEPMRQTVATKPKEGAVKQEVERNDELIRSGIRAIIAITRIPNAESNIKFEEFVRTSVRTGETAALFATLKAEGESGEGGGAADAMDTTT